MKQEVAETFGVGHTVIWAEPNLLPTEIRRKYGDGPFTVIRVDPIPAGKARKAAGHHQLVHIAKKDKSDRLMTYNRLTECWCYHDSDGLNYLEPQLSGVLVRHAD